LGCLLLRVETLVHDPLHYLYDKVSIMMHDEEAIKLSFFVFDYLSENDGYDKI
jgi:hypothetical protein